MHNFYLYYFVCGTLCGTVIFDLYTKNSNLKIQYIFFLTLFVFILIIIVYKSSKSYLKNKLKKSFFIGLLLFIFTISVTIFIGQIKFSPSILKNYIESDSKLTKYSGNKKIEFSITGIIKQEPEQRENYRKFIINAKYLEIKINKSGKKQEEGYLNIDDEIFINKIFLNENLIINVNTYENFEIGDAVSIKGKLQEPENFMNENGIEFDYVNFLKKDRIYTIIYYGQIKKIGTIFKDQKMSGSSEKNILENNLWTKSNLAIKRKIFSIKRIFLEKVSVVLPSPEAELLSGILLGTKQSLGAELENNFRRVGLIHIVVLSGYNVAIIAEAIFRFFRFLPLVVRTIFGVLMIISFSIMVGSGATVIRATIMVILAMIARIYGRTYLVNRALLVSGAIMIIINPMILFYDPSFQLSFLATFGLINLGGHLENFFARLHFPKKLQLREISAATVSTQIAVLPLLMRMTGELSIVAPVVNIITLQFIPAIMFFGFIATLISFINEISGIFFGFMPYFLLKYILFIVNFFAKLSFATIKI